MSSNMDMDEQTFQEIYFPAFETTVKKGGIKNRFFPFLGYFESLRECA